MLLAIVFQSSVELAPLLDAQSRSAARGAAEPRAAGAWGAPGAARTWRPAQVQRGVRLGPAAGGARASGGARLSANGQPFVNHYDELTNF